MGLGYRSVLILVDSADVEVFKVGIEDILKNRKSELLSMEQEEEYIDFIGRVGQKEDNLQILIRLPLKDSIGVQEVRDLHERRVEKDCESAMLIIGDRFTHYARKEAEATEIEVLKREHIFFNIFQHELVPSHEKVSEEERQELFDTYNVEPHNFPKIKRSDPTVKNINAKKGDIIRVYRQGETVKKFATYRIVVD